MPAPRSAFIRPCWRCSDVRHGGATIVEDVEQLGDARQLEYTANVAVRGNDRNGASACSESAMRRNKDADNDAVDVRGLCEIDDQHLMRVSERSERGVYGLDGLGTKVAGEPDDRTRALMLDRKVAHCVFFASR